MLSKCTKVKNCLVTDTCDNIFERTACSLWNLPWGYRMSSHLVIWSMTGLDGINSSISF
jgi:hypothetical protein